MKGGFGEVDEGEGSEICRDEKSGERGSCLIIGGSGSKSLRGWRILITLKALLLSLKTSHAGGFCNIGGSIIILGSGLFGGGVV